MESQGRAYGFHTVRVVCAVGSGWQPIVPAKRHQGYRPSLRALVWGRVERSVEAGEKHTSPTLSCARAKRHRLTFRMCHSPGLTEVKCTSTSTSPGLRCGTYVPQEEAARSAADRSGADGGTAGRAGLQHMRGSRPGRRRASAARGQPGEQPPHLNGGRRLAAPVAQDLLHVLRAVNSWRKSHALSCRL